MSAVLKTIQKVDGKYAITCLPCHAKAIRLACRVHKKLTNRILCLAGLVCGHGVNRFFAEFATEKAGARAEAMERVIFRTKSATRPASDLGTDCFWRDTGGVVKKNRVYWSQGIGRAWSGYWFVPNPCLYCDDIFAETADIVFMDAWLPEYIIDFRGTNLIAARSHLAARICDDVQKSRTVSLKHCSPENLIKSQAGVIINKKVGLAHRLWISKEKGGGKVPIKRVSPQKAKGMLERMHWMNQIRAVETGASLWSNRAGLELFEQHMFNLTFWELKLTGIKKKLLLPVRALRKIKRLLLKDTV